MKEIFFIEIKKPGGIKSRYGKRSAEVFISHGRLSDPKDAVHGFASEKEAEDFLPFAESNCINMGMMIASSKVIKLTLRE